jgi:hypothetical protein
VTSDTLERELAARLRDVGDFVPDVLEPPVDLELRVARRRRRSSRARRTTAFAVAACVAFGVAVVAVVARASSPSRVGVAASISRSDAMNLLSDTVMLDARDRYAVGLNANGRQIITVAASHSGKVVNAQLTRDHKTLWYLSVAGTPGVDCGKLVRADIATGDSRIVGTAIAFGISPDGSRIALSGRGACAPAPATHLLVRDLISGRVSSAPDTAAPTVISWSPNGDRLVARTDRSTAYDVPARLGRALAPRDMPIDGPAAFGVDGLYVLEAGRLDRWSLSLTKRTTVVANVGPSASQVVPTAAGTYVVARSEPGGPADQLYVVDHGALVHVRDFRSFGTMTPVLPAP